jgi:uncharacterized protein (TIRG00374 family)
MRWRRRVAPILRLLVSLTLMWLVYRKIPLGDLAQQFARMVWPPLAVVAVLLVGNTAVSAWKWQILLRSNRVVVPFGRLFASYLAGTFFNIFLPSSIGGDAYRVYDIARRTDDSASSFASVLADRLSGFLALSALALMAATVIARRLAHPEVVAMPVAGLTGLAVIIWMLFRQHPIRRLAGWVRLHRLPRLNRMLERILAAFSQYRRHPAMMGRILLLSVGFHCSVVLCVYLLAAALHISAPLIYFATFVPLITLLEALPISIYGLGIRDLAYAYFFAMAGMTALETRSLAVLFLAVNLVYALFGGVVFASGWLRPPPSTDD